MYICLVWQKFDRTEKTILNGLNGVFQPGRFTAIMGASGAGKTSLLNVLSGEAGQGTVNGEIFVNNQKVGPEELKEISGFVFQDDVIQSTMTVRECISMSATLRLPKESPETRREKVERIIKELGLEQCADTFIGDAQLKGVSGGERKRCSIAMEVVTDPKIIFLDEPTTGLDTFTAFTVIKKLKKLAFEHSKTIIATLHQPSSQMFHMIDDLILLADGYIMYQGPANQVVQYFKTRGYPCPKNSNPADFIFYRILNTDKSEMPPIDLTQISSVDATKLLSKDSNEERISNLLQEWSDSDEYRAILNHVENRNKGGISHDSKKLLSSLYVQVC